MVNLLATQQPAGVKDKGSDQAVLAKPSARFLKAFGRAKGLMPIHRSETPALPLSHCPALPCSFSAGGQGSLLCPAQYVLLLRHALSSPALPCCRSGSTFPDGICCSASLPQLCDCELTHTDS